MSGQTPRYHEELRELDPYEFEEFVAALWEQKGWETAVTTKSNDGGVDVIATKTGIVSQKQLIQAKCYGEDTKVGRSDIQQYNSLTQQRPDADAVVIVTTGKFTKGAKDTADQLGVKLVDGEELSEKIEEKSAEDLVARYTSSTLQKPEPESTVTAEEEESEQESVDPNDMTLPEAGIAVARLLVLLGLVIYLLFIIVTTLF